MSSELMMRRPTRLSLPNFLQAEPNAGTRAIRPWRQRITFSRRIPKGKWADYRIAGTRVASCLHSNFALSMYQMDHER